jgi:hypothetical protein
MAMSLDLHYLELPSRDCSTIVMISYQKFKTYSMVSKVKLKMDGQYEIPHIICLMAADPVLAKTWKMYLLLYQS